MTNRASYVRLALLALLWGSSFLWISLALRGFSPVQITFARLGLGASILVAIVLARRLPFPRGWKTWAHLVVAALFANATPYLLFGLGQQTVASNVAGALNATTPLWTLAFAIAVGTDRNLTPRRGIGLTLGFVGTLLIFAPWSSAHDIASWGGLACLAAAASYGLSYVYMGRFLVNRGVRPLVLSASQLAAAALLLLLAMPMAGMQTPTWRADAITALVILGACGTGIAYILNYRLIIDEGPTATSTVTYLLPVVAVILGALVLSETVTVPMVAGIALVLAGIALARRRATSRACRT